MSNNQKASTNCTYYYYFPVPATIILHKDMNFEAFVVQYYCEVFGIADYKPEVLDVSKGFQLKS